MVMFDVAADVAADAVVTAAKAAMADKAEIVTNMQCLRLQ